MKCQTVRSSSRFWSIVLRCEKSKGITLDKEELADRFIQSISGWLDMVDDNTMVEEVVHVTTTKCSWMRTRRGWMDKKVHETGMTMLSSKKKEGSSKWHGKQQLSIHFSVSLHSFRSWSTTPNQHISLHIGGCFKLFTCLISSFKRLVPIHYKLHIVLHKSFLSFIVVCLNQWRYCYGYCIPYSSTPLQIICSSTSIYFPIIVQCHHS